MKISQIQTINSQNNILINRKQQQPTTNPIQIQKEVKELPKPTICDKFSEAGYFGSIVSLAIAVIPFVNIFACGFGVIFGILSLLGRKTTVNNSKTKAFRGIIFAILTIIVGLSSKSPVIIK